MGETKAQRTRSIDRSNMTSAVTCVSDLDSYLSGLRYSTLPSMLSTAAHSFVPNLFSPQTDLRVGRDCERTISDHGDSLPWRS